MSTYVSASSRVSPRITRSPAEIAMSRCRQSIRRTGAQMRAMSASLEAGLSAEALLAQPSPSALESLPGLAEWAPELVSASRAGLAHEQVAELVTRAGQDLAVVQQQLQLQRAVELGIRSADLLLARDTGELASVPGIREALPELIRTASAAPAPEFATILEQAASGMGAVERQLLVRHAATAGLTSRDLIQARNWTELGQIDGAAGVFPDLVEAARTGVPERELDAMAEERVAELASGERETFLGVAQDALENLGYTLGPAEHGPGVSAVEAWRGNELLLMTVPDGLQGVEVDHAGLQDLTCLSAQQDLEEETRALGVDWLTTRRTDHVSARGGNLIDGATRAADSGHLARGAVIEHARRDGPQQLFANKQTTSNRLKGLA